MNHPVILRVLALFLCLLVAACARAPDPASLDFDPYEARNREIHATNVDIDRRFWGPASRAYGRGVPEPVRTGISNFRANWRLPHHVVHYLLQGRPGLAGQSALRFVVNTTAGVGGLFDLATHGGIPYRYTDTDETLHRWGVREGGYVVLPVGGPGTERDWTGWFLDFATDPATFLLPAPALNALLATTALDLANQRYALDPALGAILYDSADSYTSLRISYLQSRRARLQDGIDLDLLEDIYDD